MQNPHLPITQLRQFSSVRQAGFLLAAVFVQGLCFPSSFGSAVQHLLLTGPFCTASCRGSAASLPRDHKMTLRIPVL